MAGSSLHAPMRTWYDDHARDLPWRHEGVSGWEVLVSEVMLQQTPVSRVLPVFHAWMDRWPTPGALADEAAGEAIRMWGRLGYPRRALRLHRAATMIDSTYNGTVPSDPETLRSLPGVGDYTAAAVAAFAYHRRVPVLDTNVRRVLARVVAGVQFPARSGPSRAERNTAANLLPTDGAAAARWSVAVMELGALVCTAGTPRCTRCPLADQCRWRADGFPPEDGPPRRVQTYAGTDRQCRGRILAVLRDADTPVPRSAVDDCWDDPQQRERALATLLDDGLVIVVDGGAFALP